MEYITVSAKTLDDAITEALIQLGVTSDQLDYQVQRRIPWDRDEAGRDQGTQKRSSGGARA